MSTKEMSCQHTPATLEGTVGVRGGDKENVYRTA